MIKYQGKWADASYGSSYGQMLGATQWRRGTSVQNQVVCWLYLSWKELHLNWD